jgi:hypothetical protein
MSDFCTILTTKLDLKAIAEILHNAKATFDIDGDFDKWDTIILKFEKSELRFTKSVRERPGDKFSKMILGMHNYFRNVDTRADSNKEHILQKVGETKLAVGVVGQPEFSEEDGHFDYIFSVTKKIDGMIFNGEGMLDYKGDMILYGDGSFDYEMTA